MIYVISTGRCGTNLLFHFFREHYPELEIGHQKKWSRIINIICNTPLSKKTKSNLIKSIFRTCRQEKIPNSTVDPLVSFALLFWLKTEISIDTKIIHLVREPQAYASSFANWSKKDLYKKILHYFIPFWMPAPDRSTKKKLDWRSLNKHDKFLWTWFFKNNHFRSLQSKDYFLIRMEELTGSGDIESTWTKMIDFLNLPHKQIDYNFIASNKVNQSTRFRANEDHSVSNSNVINSIPGFQRLISDLGY